MKNISVANSRNLAPRKRSARTERLGYILFDNQTATVPCRVREFSQEGAVLTMDGWMGVPGSFSLFGLFSIFGGVFQDNLHCNVG